MKKAAVLLIMFIFLMGCNHTSNIEETKVEDYNFELNSSTIEGQLTVRLFYGPPGYGENPKTDKRLYPFVLHMEEEIDIIALEDDIHNSDKFNIREIQIIPKNKEQTDILYEYVNKPIKVKGTLFEAVLGHAHHTDVVK